MVREKVCWVTCLPSCTTLPMIGKFSLSLHQKCIKVDDAEIDFFLNNTKTHLIKTCCHQISSVTEPESSIPIGSTSFFKTTNICNPFEKIENEKKKLRCYKTFGKITLMEFKICMKSFIKVCLNSINLIFVG